MGTLISFAYAPYVVQLTYLNCRVVILPDAVYDMIVEQWPFSEP